ncbi:DUF5956 family protein [Micromonospora sp. NPDC049523]|uniref:DUF5956 family protein n=1 Tax=Micromonospora sp. NPDC049523 TaxID=3155921 RepID=UPI003444722C
MVTIDWGLDQPPAPAAGEHMGKVAAEASQLPEVRELIGQGWELAPAAPHLGFLPAVWPRRLRTWVPDRSTHYEQRYVTTPATGATRTFTAVSSEEELAVVERDLDSLLAQSGVTGRPRGRLWLLKPPPGFDSVDAFLQHVGQRIETAATPASSSIDFVRTTAEALEEPLPTPE